MNGVHTSPNSKRAVTTKSSLEVGNSQVFYKKTLIGNFFNLKINGR